MEKQTKSTNIPWMETIPASWNIKRVKYLAQLKGRIGWQGLTSNEYTAEGPYLITGIDFSNGEINWNNCVHITEERWREAPDIHIKNGDLLITKDGTIGKVAIVSNLKGKASLNSGVLLIRTEPEYSQRFLYWVLQSDVFWIWFRLKNAGNSTIIHLYQNDFAEFSYTFPDIHEQQAIADFLDNQCAQIDNIIADIEQQIEILQKYKKSLITETVTKGLDKSAPMKNSGIVWIGDIPEKWNMKPLKFLTACNQSTLPEHTQPEYLFRYVDIGAVTYEKGISEYQDISFEEAPSRARRIVAVGDTIISTVRTYLMAIALIDDDANVVVSTGFAVYTSLPLLHPKYLNYYCKSEGFIQEVDKYSYGIAYPAITTELLNKIAVPLPDYSEQQAIVDFLDKQCNKINSVLADKQSQLTTIQQYKKSLIYEYVTGKKRVSEAKDDN